MPDKGTLQGWLERSWFGGRRVPWLKPLALLFAGITGLRRSLYRRGWLASHRSCVPVVVVGNISVGGTGKTPLVIWLAIRLREQGRRAGVVLRGYGGSTRGPVLVTASSDPREVGDEALLIARRTGCPVAVGARRSAAAALLESQGCDLLISDDGLQHLAMRRDLEIVVVDGVRGVGNGALLPQGPLREGTARLRSVDAVVINGPDATALAASLRNPLHMSLGEAVLRSLVTDQIEPLDGLRGAQVHAVAATGNPARFFAQLRGLGCRPIEHPFPDHYQFQPGELAFGDEPVVMTEKDAVKCRPFATGRMLYLQVSAVLPDDGSARLMGMVQACITKGTHT
ncbi:MAG: tetraacyldisaccharide 4'-kinase [Steroidobacteraceae bacterium]